MKRPTAPSVQPLSAAEQRHAEALTTSAGTAWLANQAAEITEERDRLRDEIARQVEINATLIIRDRDRCAELQRANDLVTELRRHVAALERRLGVPSR
jgi:uncharacterized protein YecT (DUF1311 family)